jgi:hypothetical protein
MSSSELLELTDKQKLDLLNTWNSRKDDPPSLLELIQDVAGFKGKDGRSKEGRTVKAYLASRQLKARGSHEYQPVDKAELTESQKEYIANNVQTMNGAEMAKVIFDDQSLSNLNIETRTVNKYIKTLKDQGIQTFEDPQEASTDRYKPPKTDLRMIQRINRYVLDGIDEKKVSPKQKRDVKSIIGYLHTFRFSHQINSYNGNTDRELFESSFVRYTYDKNDLTQEEVDQYILLAAEVVIASSIQERVERLQNMLDDTADDTEGRRISMSLVEAISSRQTEYNQCVNRQQKLLESLKEKRSAKLSKQIKETASILNLVEMWKEEESRKKMIRLAELRKKVLEKEVEKLTSMDEVKARVMGLSEDEVLNG